MNPDAGEVRTLGYKAPAEVMGLYLHEVTAPAIGCTSGRHPRIVPQEGYLSALARPLSWSFHLHGGADRAAGRRVVVVLAPAASADGDVYGVRSLCCPWRLVPTTAELASDQAVPSADVFSAPFRSAPLPEAQPQRALPMWGVLWRCSAAASAALEPLLRADAALGDVAALDGIEASRLQPRLGADERAAACDAAAVAADYVGSMSPADVAAVDVLPLPPDVTEALGSLRVWREDARVDWASPTLEVRSASAAAAGLAAGRARDGVCTLTATAVSRVRDRLCK